MFFCIYSIPYSKTVRGNHCFVSVYKTDVDLSLLEDFFDSNSNSRISCCPRTIDSKTGAGLQVGGGENALRNLGRSHTNQESTEETGGQIGIFFGDLQHLEIGGARFDSHVVLVGNFGEEKPTLAKGVRGVNGR